LALAALLGLAILSLRSQASIRAVWRCYANIAPYAQTQIRQFVLTAKQELALQPLGLPFQECAKDCPEMIVVPRGEFIMGSSQAKKGSGHNEYPEHAVAFARPFAVSRYDVTFEQYKACVDHGDCDPPSVPAASNRNRHPVVYVTWYDASRYAAWLARVSGRLYRLLTEAEWEYVVRAGSTTAYSF